MLDTVVSVALLLAGLVSPRLELTQAGTPPQQVRVFVRNGQDSENDTKKRDEILLEVHVEDATGNPAAGARVEFSAPPTGASGVFASGSRAVTVTADQAGTAEVRGFRPNNVPGSFEITVRAFYQGEEGTTAIRQKNIGTVASPKKWIAILGGAGGAAAAIAAFSGGDSSSGSNNPPVVPDAPNLTISAQSSAPTLVRGSSGSFMLTVGNNGAVTTSGAITVTDTLPTGLTPTTAEGTGWTCNVSGQTATCTRSDALTSRDSFPPITIGVNVAGDAPASVTNTATVSGGNSNTAGSGSVTVSTGGGPDLTMSKTASSPSFSRGGTGSFTLTVTNSGGIATSGTVTVTDSLPAGLAATAAAGTGWTCGISGQVVTCTRTDFLNAGASYPPISIAISISSGAAASVTNSATVSGGGDTTPATGSVTVSTITGPDLNISKTPSAPSFARGGTGSFTLTVINNGGTPTNGTAVTVTDAVPGGLTPTAATGTGWTCNISGQTVTCTRSDVLNAAASYPAISIAVSVAGNVAASVTNSASVSGGGDTTAATGSATVNTQSGPNLTLSKTPSAATLRRGSPASFTLTATNSGDTATSGTVTVSDPVPTGLRPTGAAGPGWTCSISAQVVNCTRADALNAGASYPGISVSVDVAADAPPSIMNTATVSGGGDTTPGTGSATVNTIVGPDLAISKTASAPTLRKGGPAGFALTVINNGDAGTNGTTVTVTDPMPAGLNIASVTGGGWNCSVAGQNITCTRSDALNPGASYPVISISVTVAAEVPVSITNTASVIGGGDPTPANGSVTVDTASGPDLAIAKTASAPSLRRGSTGSFTLAVTNIGDVATSGAVTVTDTVPAGMTPTTTTGTGWTCSAAGQAVSCTRSEPLAPGTGYPPITLNVSVAADAPASVTNTASVGGGGDPTPGTGSVTVSTAAGPDLTISKTASAPSLRRGSTGSFTLTVTNGGDTPTNATDVTVTDPLPAGLTPGTVSGTGWTCNVAGQTATCTRSDSLNPAASYPAITVNVSVAGDAPASLTNTATVVGGGDTTPANGAVTVSTAAGPDLTIAKTASAPSLRRGGTGSFTLTVTNGGDSATNATAVTVTDALPLGLTPGTVSGTGWTCNVAGQIATCTRADALNAAASYPAITFNVNVAADAPASVTNTASVVGGGDTTPANGAVTISTARGPDLTVSKTASAPTFARGGTGAFAITVANTGDTATAGVVTVTDQLPPGLTPTTAGGPLWTCPVTGQTVTCTRSDALNPGASYPGITIIVSVGTSAAASLTNSATASGGGDDTSATGSVTVATTGTPALSITKTASAPNFIRGGTGSFTLTVSNSGAATNGLLVTITDTLPVGLQPAAAAGTGWGCTRLLQTVTCTRIGPVLNPGESYPEVKIDINVPNAAPLGALTNTATVSGGGDPASHDGSATVTIVASMSIAMAVDQPLVGPGDSVAFSLNVDNPTDVPLADATLNGTLPSGFTYTPGSAKLLVIGPGGETMPAVAITPAITPDGLQFTIGNLPSGGRAAITYAALVTSKARPGELQSRAAAFATLLSGGRVNAVPAHVRLVVRPSTFALTQVLIGRVFEDLNRNGTFDNGEPGVPNVRVVSSGGQAVTTDANGQYNLPTLAPGSIAVALDPSSLPKGLTAVSQSRVLRSPLGGGTALRQNFPLVRTQVNGTANSGTAQHAPLVVAVGEVGIGLSGAGPEAGAEAKRIDADVSIFYQNSLSQRDTLTVAVRSKDSVNSASGNNGLFEADPAQRQYAVMGDGSTRQQLAQSNSRVYARYDRGRSYIMYGDLQGDTAGQAINGGDGLLDYSRNVTGIRFRLDQHGGPDWFEGQIARPRTAYTREISTALTGPAVRLSRAQILPGSETITLEVRDRRNPERIISREVLIRNVDYTLDPASGVLFMMRSIGLFDSSLNLVQLISAYEYQTAGADSTMYLGRGSYSVPKTGLRLGFSALTQNQEGMNFAVGGFQMEKQLPNGGRFSLDMPMSTGQLLTDTNPQSGHNGKALRAELEQPLVARDTVIRARLSNTDNGFFNPYGVVTVQGQESRSVSVETRAFASGRLGFAAGKEVNRNSAVDNQRKTVSVKLSQTIRENLLAETGIDFRQFSDRKAGDQIDSQLISAGLKWNPFTRLETSVVREQNLSEADPTYPSQTLLGTQFKISSSSRLFATQRFSSAPIVPIGGAEISGLLSPQSTRETAIGMESKVRENTSMTTRYRVDSGPAGTDSFAVLGLLTRVPVRNGVSIDWSLDNAVHLAGSGRGYVGGSVGFSQVKDDKLISAVRYELRRREVSEHIFTAGLAGRLTASTSALARYRINSSAWTPAGKNAQLAVAVRPRQSDRVALLFSYDYGALNAGVVNSGIWYNRQINRISADGLLQVRRGLEFYSRVAAARTPGSDGGKHTATYLQGRLQQSLRRRFDIAGEARWIRESANVGGTLATGLEWGTWLSPDFRIGLGYSPGGFTNPGALLNSTAARGGAYLVISSRLSSLFELVGSSK